MKKDVRQIKDIVAEILSESLRSRADDKFLVMNVIERMGFGKINLQTMTMEIDIEQLSQMPSFESIPRCRRKYQQQGLYLPPQEIVEERESRGQEMADINSWFGIAVSREPGDRMFPCKYAVENYSRKVSYIRKCERNNMKIYALELCKTCEYRRRKNEKDNWKK